MSLFGEPEPEPLPQPEEHEREETGPPLWSRPVVAPSAPAAPGRMSYREALVEQLIRDAHALEDEHLDRSVCALPGCTCGFSWERFFEERIQKYAAEIRRIDAGEPVQG